MNDLLDSAAKRRRVPDDHAASRPFQAQAVDGRSHGVLLTNRAFHLRHAELRFHGSGVLSGLSPAPAVALAAPPVCDRRDLRPACRASELLARGCAAT